MNRASSNFIDKALSSHEAHLQDFFGLVFNRLNLSTKKRIEDLLFMYCSTPAALTFEKSATRGYKMPFAANFTESELMDVFNTYKDVSEYLCKKYFYIKLKEFLTEVIEFIDTNGHVQYCKAACGGAESICKLIEAVKYINHKQGLRSPRFNNKRAGDLKRAILHAEALNHYTLVKNASAGTFSLEQIIESVEKCNSVGLKLDDADVVLRRAFERYRAKIKNALKSQAA